jgi:hypothetical protein
MKLMGINFDNAFVNINEFCILTWWLLYNVHQPLKKKKQSFNELSREGVECEGVNERVNRSN